MRNKLFILLFISIISVSSVFGQSPERQDDEDFQSWNEVQLTVPMTKHFDFFVSTTARFGNNISRLNEGRFGLGYVWKPNKALTISPHYEFIRGRNSALKFKPEHRLQLSASYKFPIKSFGLIHRSRFEYRIRRGQDDSWRYRPSIKLEKDLPESWIPGAKVYLMEEPFYVSTTKKFSRNRVSVGISKVINKNLSLDLYYLRQNDGYSHPGDLNVIGTSWKVKL